MLKNVLSVPKSISNRFNKDHVGTYASQATFFMVLSVFPLAMLILSLVKYTPVTRKELSSVLVDFVPRYFEGTLIHLINEIYRTSNGAVLSITAIGSLWAASKGVMALLLGFNEIYHHNQDRNWFFLRFMSIIYTIFFIIIMVMVLIFLVFGTTLVNLVIENLPAWGNVAITTFSITSFVSFFILTIFFLLIYAIVRSRVFGMIDNVPGALFSSAGWIIASFFFSAYIEKFAGKSATYGSMTTIILAMLWIYILMYILFIGAEINVFCKKIFLLSRIKKARKRIKKGKKATDTSKIEEDLTDLKKEMIRVDDIEETNKELEEIINDEIDNKMMINNKKQK